MKKFLIGIIPILFITGCNFNVEENNFDFYENGTVVYYNPESNKKCNEDLAKANINENGTPTGIKTGCMKWYIFNDDANSSTVNMILDHNTTPLVAYNINGEKKIQDVKIALENDTKTWNNTLNSRLISADEIATISGNSTFNSSRASNSEWFNLETNTKKEPTSYSGKYSWLFDNLKGQTEADTLDGIIVKTMVEDNNEYDTYDGLDFGYITGYWTSSTVANLSEEFKSIADSEGAWKIGRTGELGWYYVKYSNTNGVRPVITVSKNIIK